MKSNKEIMEFCKTKCDHSDCKSKDLKIAKNDRTFMGRIVTPKGSYYCAHKK